MDSSDIFNQYIAKYPEIIDIKKAFDDENEEKDKNDSLCTEIEQIKQYVYEWYCRSRCLTAP